MDRIISFRNLRTATSYTINARRALAWSELGIYSSVARRGNLYHCLRFSKGGFTVTDKLLRKLGISLDYSTLQTMGTKK